jgi:hypothetical protein
VVQQEHQSRKPDMLRVQPGDDSAHHIPPNLICLHHSAVLKAEADSETTQIGILYTNRDHLMRSGCERQLVYYQNDVFFAKAIFHA